MNINCKDMINLIIAAGGQFKIVTTENMLTTVEDECGYLLRYRKVKGKLSVTMKKFGSKIIADEKVEVDEEGFDSDAMFIDFIKRTNEEGYQNPNPKTVSKVIRLRPVA